MRQVDARRVGRFTEKVTDLRGGLHFLFYLKRKRMIQLPGLIQGFVEALPFHVDGTAGGEVADPAAMDGQRGVGRRDAGIDVGADAFHAGLPGPLEAGLDAGGVSFGRCLAGGQETGLDGRPGAWLG